MRNRVSHAGLEFLKVLSDSFVKKTKSDRGMEGENDIPFGDEIDLFLV